MQIKTGSQGLYIAKEILFFHVANLMAVLNSADY